MSMNLRVELNLNKGTKYGLGGVVREEIAAKRLSHSDQMFQANARARSRGGFENTRLSFRSMPVAVHTTSGCLAIVLRAAGNVTVSETCRP